MTMMRMHPFLSASTTARGSDACRGGGCRERGSADLASKHYTDFQVATWQSEIGTARLPESRSGSVSRRLLGTYSTFYIVL